jgi:hypothetical protein
MPSSVASEEELTNENTKKDQKEEDKSVLGDVNDSMTCVDRC